jgi:hypothetical protein
MTDPVSIKSGDFWVKVVEMLQQNWALIDIEPDSSARVIFTRYCTPRFGRRRVMIPEPCKK